MRQLMAQHRAAISQVSMEGKPSARDKLRLNRFLAQMLDMTRDVQPVGVSQ